MVNGRGQQGTHPSFQAKKALSYSYRRIDGKGRPGAHPSFAHRLLVVPPPGRSVQSALVLAELRERGRGGGAWPHFSPSSPLPFLILLPAVSTQHRFETEVGREGRQYEQRRTTLLRIRNSVGLIGFGVQGKFGPRSQICGFIQY